MRKLLLALFALAFALPAQAQNYQATQGTGTTFGTKLVSTVNYPQWVLCDPATPANCASVSASGQLTIANTTFAATQSGTWNITNLSGTVSLPTGASTATNQSTEITSLGTIATNSGTQATAANQTAGNTSLATIATNSALSVPVNVNTTPTAQTGVTQGTTPTGNATSANVIDTPGSTSETDCSASPTTSAASFLTASVLHRKMVIKVEGASNVCFNRTGGTATIGTAGTFCLKGATTANSGDGASYSTMIGQTDTLAWSAIAATATSLVSCSWQ